LAHINHKGVFPFTQGLDPLWEQELKAHANEDIEIVCELDRDPMTPHANAQAPLRVDVPVTRFAQSLLSALAHVPMQDQSQCIEARVHLKLIGSDPQQLHRFAQLARKTWAVMLKTHFQQKAPQAQQLLVLLERTPSAQETSPLREMSDAFPLNQTPWETLLHLESATWDAMDAIETLDGYGAPELQA
jgi:hypothetical protein